MIERTILWPYSDFDIARKRLLGGILYHLVNENHQTLAERGLLSGTSALRYCQLSRHIAAIAVFASARQDRIWQEAEERSLEERQRISTRPGIGHYVIVAGSPHLDPFDTKQTGIIGTGTVRPVTRKHNSTSPSINPDTYHVVSAWVDGLSDPEETRLREALQILTGIANNRAIVFEPNSSSEVFHKAIVTAGFRQQPVPELAVEGLRISPHSVGYITH